MCYLNHLVILFQVYYCLKLYEILFKTLLNLFCIETEIPLQFLVPSTIAVTSFVTTNIWSMIELPLPHLQHLYTIVTTFLPNFGKNIN